MQTERSELAIEDNHLFSKQRSTLSLKDLAKSLIQKDSVKIGAHLLLPKLQKRENLSEAQGSKGV